MARNEDSATIDAFGEEWTRFDNATLSADELAAIFAQYFGQFPWASLPVDARGFDAGCGSGRWARWSPGASANCTASTPAPRR